MPTFDFRCECGHGFESLIRAGDIPRCPACHSLLVTKEWTKTATVVGDECDFVQENGLPHPVRIRSMSEYRRLMKENGNEQCVRHVGVPGTDKSPHTTNWGAVTQQTLDGAREMLERPKGKSIEQLESDLDDAVESGEVGVPVPVGGGRSVNIRVGRVYSGVLDHEALKR